MTNEGELDQGDGSEDVALSTPDRAETKTIPRFDLSTEEAPSAELIIDGKEYVMRDMRHVSRADELKMKWLISRESQLNIALNKAARKNDERGAELISDEIANVEIDLLVLMCTAPKNIVMALRFPDRRKLTKHIAEAAGLGNDDENDEDVVLGSPA